MILNQKKIQVMLFNLTHKFQFSTRLQSKNTNIEIVSEAKVLGTIVTDDLKWDANCSFLIRMFSDRMQLLQKVASFGEDQNDLKQVYVTFCRMILEQSCEVWSGNITKENKIDFGRCQIAAFILI